MFFALQVISCSTSLITAIDAIPEGVADFIYNKAQSQKQQLNEGQTLKDHWVDLNHAMGRILSIEHAVKTIIAMADRFPELFENFTVTTIPSQVKSFDEPFRSKNPASTLTVEEVIGRMTSDTNQHAMLTAATEGWWKFDFNNRLRREVAKFKPIVHAELLVLQSILRDVDDGGASPYRFFKRQMYIGCSKPTCKMCHYYFESHPSGVRVQPSHGNFYRNWRVPNVAAADGVVAAKARDRIMNDVVAKVRTEVTRIIRDKTLDGKRHDSETNPTWQSEHGHVRPMHAGDEDSDLEVMVGELTLDEESPTGGSSTSPAPEWSTRSSSFDSRTSAGSDSRYVAIKHNSECDEDGSSDEDSLGGAVL
jgi:hypothetical protein